MRLRRIPRNCGWCNGRNYSGDWGERIRELRLKHGWTQDVFADKSGLHRAQVGAFERREMNITLASLLLRAQTLKVKVVDLFKGLDD
jgi:transcriptional regulator with XRE-family HTH domain